MKTIDSKDYKPFLKEYHLQENVWGVKVAYWLYDGDELVMVTTRWLARYNKNYEWELLRLCTKSWVVVVWWFNKLLKHFIKENSPTSILSYCDVAKFSGNTYLEAWFEEVKNEPSIHFYHPTIWKHIRQYDVVNKWFDALMWGTPAPCDCVFTKDIFRKWYDNVEWEDLTIKKWDPLPFFNEITPNRSTNNTKLLEAIWFVRIPDCWQTRYIWKNPLDF